MMEMLANTYSCVASRKLRLVRNLVPAPFSISPTSPSSSSTSHIHHFITSNLCKFLVMNPKHSSHMYHLAIEAFDLAILCTYNFKGLHVYFYKIHPPSSYKSKHMGSRDPFEYLKHKLWPNERLGVEVPIWFLTIKSWESPWFTSVCIAHHISMESSQQGLQLCFILHLNQRFTQVMDL
jgi:hypothetical protein